MTTDCSTVYNNVNDLYNLTYIHRTPAEMASSRTGSILDQQSPGRFATSPGIPGLRIFRPAGWLTLTGLSRNANITLTGLLPTLRDYLSTLTTGLPDIPEPPS